MPHRFSDIALVLFTRTAAEEVREKNFLPQGSPAQQLAVAEKLIQNSHKLLACTGLPYFIYSSAEQKGNNFGERLQNAFANFFALGFKRVIIIGNDCPQLTPTDILRAASKLQEQGVVVGPDTSGGVYLLGLTQASFTRKSSFEHIRWNSARVLTDIAAAFDIAAADLNFLAKYTDLNNSRAFAKAFRQKLFRSGLRRFFRQLLGLITTRFNYPETFRLPFFYTRSLCFRGPPFLY
ncbi:hypothetical protein AAE02nite_44380 [Adhaeribacter aerolatus]|uniref:DUF2064 domain-containing protein n=1 Tax=Adhaeribacter aerolatus TaxID=670289 RepID=A0A512B491_9BACT|nr:DUF2064 domain-containing protein [Adhaeribacter aerolatus]GEO06774.1 hypothetical protein AAE02nite_44380 [Adhaeribacter aerolatus]